MALGRTAHPRPYEEPESGSCMLHSQCPGQEDEEENGDLLVVHTPALDVELRFGWKEGDSIRNKVSNRLFLLLLSASSS